jgi:hypothetical protein
MSAQPLRLEVLSAASEPGGSSPNEDRYGVTDTGYAWVLDGATSTGPARIAERGTDGAWLADRIDALLHELAVSPDHPEPHQMLEHIASTVRSDLVTGGIDPDDRPPYASVALISLKGDRLDYAVLGDVALVIARPGEAVIEVRDHRSDKFVQMAIDLSYRYAGDELKAEQRAFEERYVNTIEGYPILSSSVEHGKDALRDVVKVGPDTSVLMASDGLTRRVEVGSDVPDLGHLIPLVDPRRGEGVGETIAALRSQERGDADRTRRRRIKVHDDATGLLLHII